MVMIQKSTKGKGGKVRVVFTMPAMEDCDCLYLVGRFSEWNESVYRMQRAGDGTWSLTLELEPEHEFQYRFRTSDGKWLEDRPQISRSVFSDPNRHSLAIQPSRG